jgi:hypothetical protein
MQTRELIPRKGVVCFSNLNYFYIIANFYSKADLVKSGKAVIPRIRDCLIGLIPFLSSAIIK